MLTKETKEAWSRFRAQKNDTTTVKVRSTSRLLLFWITIFRCLKAPKSFIDWLIILIKENEIIFRKVRLYLFLLLF